VRDTGIDGQSTLISAIKRDSSGIKRVGLELISLKPKKEKEKRNKTKN